MVNAHKTAIVTGASQGIGAGLVEAFLKRGYSVVANSRSIMKTIHLLNRRSWLVFRLALRSSWK
jgi:NAD(P)-dependent dehydrogenase (short-subunit alcohol dehydrogenase family)